LAINKSWLLNSKFDIPLFGVVTTLRRVFTVNGIIGGMDGCG